MASALTRHAIPPPAPPSPASGEVDGRLDQIIASAEAHGRESEPDHEVGDLQEALRLAWAHLSPAARRAVHVAYFTDHPHWDEMNTAELVSDDRP